MDGDAGSKRAAFESRRWAPVCLDSGTALAPGTAAVELDPGMRDAETPRRSHSPAQDAGVKLGGGAFHVGDPAAADTSEVMVLGHVAVEAGVRAGQLLDQALGHQHPQVAIHGAEAHARKATPHHSVDPLRGRVRFGGAHDVQHHPARSGEAEPAGPDRALGSLRAIFSNDSACGCQGSRSAKGLAIEGPTPVE